MRFLPALLVMAFVIPVMAAELPSGQVPVDSGKVLRGAFVEEKQVKGLDQPLRFTGKFVVAPDFGLIWGVEKPLGTSTVVTRSNAIQDVGGIAMKLKIRKLTQIYDIVGRALTGNWHSLQPDFTITRTEDDGKWHITLTPRPVSTAKLPYASIAINGAKFVESIVLKRADGISDSFTFSNEELSELPLTAQENALFAKAGN